MNEKNRIHQDRDGAASVGANTEQASSQPRQEPQTTPEASAEQKAEEFAKTKAEIMQKLRDAGFTINGGRSGGYAIIGSPPPNE